MSAKKALEIPRFKNESEEADWWASRAGRDFVERKAADAHAKGIKFKGSKLVERLKRQTTRQIALRLPQSDLTQARRIAERKGIGYQTLLKMLVREGLIRETRRG
jgi:predicted DNA binding CopG/RHH family protein